MLRIVVSAVAVAGVLAAVKPLLIDPIDFATAEDAKAAVSAREQFAPAAPALSSTVSDHSRELGTLAQAVGMTDVLAGVITAREELDRQVLARGFRPLVNVVTIYRPNQPRYSQPGLFALDDWR